MADPRGVDEHRPMAAMILKMLLRCGLSRYEAHPQHALDAAEQRGASAIEPSGDAA